MSKSIALCIAGTALCLSILAVGSANATKATDASGAKLFTEKLCHTCHGAEGKTPIAPGYPRLAGQDAVYAAAQVRDIRDGKRSNGLSAAMRPMVLKLQDDEIMAIARYLEAVQP